MDNFTGESKGFGFVEMGTRGEGHKAMEDLNGKEYKYRRLVCNEAKAIKKKGRHRRSQFRCCHFSEPEKQVEKIAVRQDQEAFQFSFNCQPHPYGYQLFPTYYTDKYT